MKLPNIQNPDRYVGLYIVDFGGGPDGQDGPDGQTTSGQSGHGGHGEDGQAGIGFTAQEVAELLESEQFKNITIYKVHRAYPDGRMEFKGVRREVFRLEMGMFFYAGDAQAAEGNFKQLTDLALKSPPPVRAVVHLARYDDTRFVTALIYPAEYNDEFSDWLIEGGYKTTGPAEGGIEAVERYYRQSPEILNRCQLFGQSSWQSRTGEELLAYTKQAVQR